MRRLDSRPGHHDLRCRNREAGSRAQLDAFVDAGGNLIDTADVYSTGTSEEIVGRWLAAQRLSDGMRWR